MSAATDTTELTTDQKTELFSALVARHRAGEDVDAEYEAACLELSGRSEDDIDAELDRADEAERAALFLKFLERVRSGELISYALSLSILELCGRTTDEAARALGVEVPGTFGHWHA